jgi:hypothetical protein
MAAAMTLRSKTSSSLMNSSKHSSPIINQIESYSPSSSSKTVSPESSNSISSSDKSFLSNEQQRQQSIHLVDYFVVCGLDKSFDVEPSPTDFISTEQVLNLFQCLYRCRVLAHYPNAVSNNPFAEDAISRLSMPDGVSPRQHSPDPPTTHPFLITRLDGTCYYCVVLTFFEQLNHDDGIYFEFSSSRAVLSLSRLIENYN